MNKTHGGIIPTFHSPPDLALHLVSGVAARLLTYSIDVRQWAFAQQVQLFKPQSNKTQLLNHHNITIHT